MFSFSEFLVVEGTRVRVLGLINDGASVPYYLHIFALRIRNGQHFTNSLGASLNNSRINLAAILYFYLYILIAIFLTKCDMLLKVFVC